MAINFADSFEQLFKGDCKPVYLGPSGTLSGESKDRAVKKLILTYWKLFFPYLFNLSLGKKKRNLIISVCLKPSRNLEILGFLREQILSKNLGESPWTGNNSLSIIPKIFEYLTFQAHVNSLHFWGEPTLAAPLLFFCAWVSHVMLTRICKCVLHPTLT